MNETTKIESVTTRTIFCGGLFLFLAAAAGSALADDHKGPLPKPESDNRVLSVTWERFRDQCENPGKFDTQRPPQDIRLNCSDRWVQWVAIAPGDVPLANERSITTEVLSDKLKVVAASRGVPVVGQAGSCHRFKEVVETYRIEVPVTCEQVLHSKFDPQEFCLNQINDSKVRNPKVVETVDTGKLTDTCSGVAR